MDTEQLTLSVTRINSMGFCPKSHHFQYDLKLKPKATGEALEFGSSVHKMLETYYKTGEMLPVMDDLGDLGRKLQSNGVAYKLMAQMEDRFTVVDVEKEFTVPLEGLNATFTGVIDAVVRLDGELWLMEHKTCSQHWNDAQLGMANQHVLYEMVAEEIYGEPVRGTIYNFLRTTTRTGEFHTDVRRVLIPSDPAVRQAVWSDLEQKLMAIRMGYSARNPGQHCKWCSMFSLCQTELLGGDMEYVITNYYQPRGNRNDDVAANQE